MTGGTELEKNWSEIERRFKDIGFDRAFPNTCSAEDAVQALTRDLGID
jgi:methylaspartate mutase sigma subunit